MSSLVEELQRDALNGDVRVPDLLRKAKTIAMKLDLPDLESWVEKELNGYPAGGEVPEYRIVNGQVKGWNPFHGWQPVQFENTSSEQRFSKRSVFQRVAELENLIANSNNGGHLHIPLSAEAKELLRTVTGYDFDFTVMVPVGFAVGILEAVHNAVLDWALKLEKSGIRGEGMSFSVDERKRAHESQTTYNIGSIGTFTGTMSGGDLNVQGDIVNAESKQSIDNLITKIRESESFLHLDSASSKHLNDALDGLHSEIAKPDASAKRISGFLKLLGSIAEKATGSLVAQGILHEISKFMK